MGAAESSFDRARRGCGSFSTSMDGKPADSDPNDTLDTTYTGDSATGTSTLDTGDHGTGGGGGGEYDEFAGGGGGDMAPLNADDMGVISVSEPPADMAALMSAMSSPNDMRAGPSEPAQDDEEELDGSMDPADVIHRNRADDLDDPIRAEYQKIFNAHGNARSGYLQGVEFVKFYKDVLMALGASEGQASDICIGGGAMSFFRSMCDDNSVVITFDQFWRAEFTQQNLLPRTGRHEAAVMKYMSQWYPGKLRRIPLDAARAPGYRGTNSLRFNGKKGNAEAEITQVQMKRLPSFMQPTRSSVNKLATRSHRTNSAPEEYANVNVSQRGSKTPRNLGRRKSLADRQLPQGHIRSKTPGAPQLRKALSSGPQAPLSARPRNRKGSHERLPSVPMILVPDAEADARAASLLGRVPSRRESSALLRLSQRGPAGSHVENPPSMQMINENGQAQSGQEQAAPPPSLAKQMTFK